VRKPAAGEETDVVGGDDFACGGFDALCQQSRAGLDDAAGVGSPRRFGSKSGDSISWKGWGHVKWFVEAVRGGGGNAAGIVVGVVVSGIVEKSGNEGKFGLDGVDDGKGRPPFLLSQWVQK
jgi:hypothetical protein